MAGKEVAKIKAAFKASRHKPVVLNRDTLLHTGSTLLNLACSGKSYGGFLKGVMTLLVGDSRSGKTFFALTCLAEASINPEYDDYEFYYDPAENGALMDFNKFFGPKVAARVQYPPGGRSRTTKDLYAFLGNLQKRKRKFIYILDSMDALESVEEQAAIDAQEAGNKEKGSMGVNKAKDNSKRLGRVCDRLQDTGSMFITVSQTRQNMGFGAQFNPKTRSGGDALRFYARIEIWTSIREKVRRKVRGKERVIGKVITAKIEKNGLNGWEGSVEVPIYRSVGFDDVGSMVRFLIKEGFWKNKRSCFPGTKSDEEWADWISEDPGRVRRLVKATVAAWREIEEATKVSRPFKYGGEK